MGLKTELKYELKKHPFIVNTYRRVRKPFVHKQKFTNFSQATVLAEKFAELIPNRFDVIVGVPRAGLFVANILASKFGRPLATVELLENGSMWYSHDAKKPEQIHNALVVEDAVYAGTQINKVKERLQKKYPDLEVKTASLFRYGDLAEVAEVDYFYRTLRGTTLFEWNILTSGWIVGELCVDMDGVLCRNCPLEDDDDGERYKRFLSEVEPNILPSFPVKAVVTARLEKYRAETEAWLKRNNIQYQELIMLNLPTNKTRTFSVVVNYKADVIRTLNPNWFWESEVTEAKAIAKKVSIPILCIQDMHMYQ